MNDIFRRVAHFASELLGSPWAFVTALTLIIIWLVAGPYFNYSNTWQLLINTCTTILTFLMVFLIQNTQNRDARAMQLKLDELIRAVKSARNELIDLEEFSDKELQALHDDFIKVREKRVHQHK